MRFLFRRARLSTTVYRKIFPACMNAAFTTESLNPLPPYPVPCCPSHNQALPANGACRVEPLHTARHFGLACRKAKTCPRVVLEDIRAGGVLSIIHSQLPPPPECTMILDAVAAEITMNGVCVGFVSLTELGGCYLLSDGLVMCVEYSES